MDRYGRTVAEIILPDGRNLNQELVRAGWRDGYRQFAKRNTVLPALEQKARAAKRGVRDLSDSDHRYSDRKWKSSRD